MGFSEVTLVFAVEVGAHCGSRVVATCHSAPMGIAGRASLLGLGDGAEVGAVGFEAGGVFLFGVFIGDGGGDDDVVAGFPVDGGGDLVLGRELH